VIFLFLGYRGAFLTQGTATIELSVLTALPLGMSGLEERERAEFLQRQQQVVLPLRILRCRS